jgi:hypothetical protein
LFFNKNKKHETSDVEDGAAETKREKSPLPGKFLGNLVRRASKAVKSETPKQKSGEPAIGSATTEPTATTNATETSAPTSSTTPFYEATTTAPEAAETKIVGDVIPEDLVAAPGHAATTTPEVKATA